MPPVITELVPGYAHPTALAPSYACVKVTGTAGAQVKVNASTTNGAFGLPATKGNPPPARPRTDSRTVTLPDNGMTTVRFMIWKTDSLYEFSLTASKDGLTSATSTTSINVVGTGPDIVVGPPDCGPPQDA